jgi:signal transduction histidine kinase
VGKELRSLAVQAALVAAVVSSVVAGGVLLLLSQGVGTGLVGGGSTLPTWVAPVAAGAVLLVSVGLALVIGRRLAERRAARLTEPMRQLAQRAEEFGTGGFALEPVIDTDRPTRPLVSGVSEIDTVGRILDHNSRVLVRALSAERSFAADASHQLRTPLAALLMRLEEIAEADDVGVARHEAEVAIAQTERLAGVVDDLLHRTRAGHADGGRSVSLDTVLSQLQREWEPTFAAEGRSISVGLERGMIVRSSASAISQILDTLVENSLIHGGGAVRVSAWRSGPSAVLEVRDDGPGIDDELARRVFDRAVTGGSGTGLGLAVARETAESFGGRLELAQARPAVFVLYVSMAPAR